MLRTPPRPASAEVGPCHRGRHCLRLVMSQRGVPDAGL